MAKAHAAAIQNRALPGIQTPRAVLEWSKRVEKAGECMHPLTEYPRPAMRRDSYENLNGLWQYAITASAQRPAGWDGEILVPYAPECRASGVGHTVQPGQWLHYHRYFAPPAGTGGRVLLHFGAVDYACAVQVNGHLVGGHRGGYWPFTLDITAQLNGTGRNSLWVAVQDPTGHGTQARGKQTLQPGGMFYPAQSGIWQTVWMEAVDEEGLKSVFATPDIDQQQLVIRPQFYSQNAANKLVVTLYDGKKEVARKSVPCGDGSVVVLPVKGMKLWSPESPFLYGLKYQVVKDGKVVDEVSSYAGMRKVHLHDGYFYLNNKPYYQRLVLDQGYYPDGIWTAPSDEALKKDIEMAKAVGFNGARLHQKSFEERYYYWADKLGYLTWGESASWGLNINNEEACRNFISEWAELVERDRNHPSLVTWTPLNETWNAENTGVYTRFVQNLYDMTKAIDGTRPVNDASGDSHIKTDIWSVHNYCRTPEEFKRDFAIEPGKEPYRNMRGDHWQWLAKYEGQPYMLDEWGGLGYVVPEKRHGNDTWGYGGMIKDAEEFYRILRSEVESIKALKHITGFCYTQITDVEQEQNGIYNYDRTPKFDTNRIKEIFELIPSNIEENKK